MLRTLSAAVADGDVDSFSFISPSLYLRRLYSMNLLTRRGSKLTLLVVAVSANVEGYHWDLRGYRPFARHDSE